MGPKMLQCDRSSDSILNKPINKNSILSKYNKDCHKLGYSGQHTSTKKGEPTHLPTHLPTTLPTTFVVLIFKIQERKQHPTPYLHYLNFD
jgi:hypothetical protein